MKAIIISDVDVRALLDKLELHAMRTRYEILGSSKESEVVDKIHRSFHYVVTTWLQEQGADAVQQ